MVLPNFWDCTHETNLRKKGMLQLNFRLFLQRLEDFQVIMLAKMFQAEADGFLLPVLLLPRDRLLDQVWSVVSQEREEPDGEVKAWTPGLDGDHFEEPYWEEVLVQLMPAVISSKKKGRMHSNSKFSPD